MVQWGMMFGHVITLIGSYMIPTVKELILLILAVEPVEAHVHGFGDFGDNGIVCDPRVG